MHRPTRRPTGRFFPARRGRSSGRLLDRPSILSFGRKLAGSAALIGVIACAGCGPFGYLKKVATDASRAVADAEAAGAEEYAPYEYWGAVAYLEQAKVLMGYSEYERSFDFGERAKQLANEAKVKAQRVKKGGSVVHDEDIATPHEMVDAEGNQIDSVNEAGEAGEAKPDEPEAKPEPKGDAEGEAKGKLEIGAEAEVGGEG